MTNKDILNYTLDPDPNDTEVDPQDEFYQRTEEAMGQFMFLFFSPNSHTRMVEVYIDKGEFHTWYTIDEFAKKIKDICGYEASSMISDACRNLGVPYFYDRKYNRLTELKEQPKKERLSISTIKDLGGFGMNSANINSNSMFEGLKDQYLGLIDKVMRSENGNAN